MNVVFASIDPLRESGWKTPSFHRSATTPIACSVSGSSQMLVNVPSFSCQSEVGTPSICWTKTFTPFGETQAHLLER